MMSTTARLYIRSATGYVEIRAKMMQDRADFLEPTERRGHLVDSAGRESCFARQSNLRYADAR